MKQTLKIVAFSALATAAVIKAVPALAEPAGGNVNVSIVATADLDLMSAAGQRALDHRLVVAVRQVCDTASASDLRAQNQERNCRRAALAEARTQSEALAAARRPSAGIQVSAR
jgi:UrcA family protein